MARLFLRLKLRLLANTFRLGWQQAAGLVLVAVIVLPLAGMVGVVIALLGIAEGDHAAGLPAVVFLLLGLAWVVLPVLAFGVDETLDPSRLQLLPLRRRQLVTGLLAASLVGAGALGTMLVVAGVVVGFSTPGLALVVSVIAAFLLVLMCVLTARVVTAALSLRLRTRRGRDTVALLAALAGVGFAFLGQLPRLLLDAEDLIGAVGEQADRIATFVPFGWPARAIAAAGAGDFAEGALWLCAAGATVVALAAAWLRALTWSMVTAPPPAVSSDSDEDLFPAAVRWLPRTRTGAAIAKELRYFSRLPQLRVALLMQPLFAAGAVVAVAVIDPLQQPQVVLVSPTFGMLFGLVALNAFGADGRALWLVVATGRLGWRDLAAKNAALAMIVLPLVAAVAITLAALAAGWSLLAPALLFAVAVLAVTTGVGNVASVLAPQPLPESPINAFAASQGTGCATAIIQLLSLSAIGLLAAPVVAGAAIALFVAPTWLPVVALLSVAWGAAVWTLGVRLAGAQLHVRGPEIVAALTPRGQ